jgi:DNA end-binding protein Ku
MSTATATRRRAHATKARGARKTDPDEGSEESRNVSKRPRRGAYRATKHEAGEDYGAFGRPLWSGSISFGLVNIPVRLHTAVREQRVAFHMLHDQDKVRLRRRMVCTEDGKEIHPEHVVRGYEVGPDKYVIIRDEELEACAPEKSKAIEITDFVELGEIDPLYFDRPYYVIPQAGASKPYRLLVEAMSRAKRVGLARLVMHEKEHLCAVRPQNGLLCIETMNFPDEIVSRSEIDDLPKDVKLSEKEVKSAQAVVREMSGRFNPRDYTDDYRECIRAAMQKLAHGENVVHDTSEEAGEDEDAKPARSASNLMAALEASLAHAKSQQPSSGSGSGSSRSSGKRRKRR